MNEGISYKELRTIHQIEKKNPNPVELDQDFYGKARSYMERLKILANSEEDEHKRKLIEDELRNVKQILLDIYGLREKKIVLSALSRARGGKPDVRSLLREEKGLFEEILGCLNKYRKIILEGKEEKKEGMERKERFLVLIKEDIPRFVGPDMKRYRLRRGDIITLSGELFDILKRKGVAERIA
ncbi:MAG TPA: DNA replication complex GINS family protein [Thermoplasmatales archaeon]|nr:DNA replication complex GINS family protein [Thermoplasmatales archaeon]HEX17455.1 DNA replication complex GINS family protein [Thermoplasmatales archaeon]